MLKWENKWYRRRRLRKSIRRELQMNRCPVCDVHITKWDITNGVAVYDTSLYVHTWCQLQKRIQTKPPSKVGKVLRLVVITALTVGAVWYIFRG